MQTHLRSHREEIHPDRVRRSRDGARTAPRDAHTSRAADECIVLLEQGLALIDALRDEDYAAAPTSPDGTGAGSWSSPGAHTRHLLDFVDCLLGGIDARRIDYTARKRRGDIESSRSVGRREVARAIEGLSRIRTMDGNRVVEVRPEPEQDWTRSTLAREIHFVSSHAVHHHALIKMTLAQRGIAAPPEYGVAPSTLAYQATMNSPTPACEDDD